MAVLPRTAVTSSILIVCLLAAMAAVPTVQMNRWSLAHWRQVASGQFDSVSAPAIRHRRAALWLVEVSLGHDSDARSVVASDAVDGTDPFARRVSAWQMVAQGDLGTAFQTWVEIGDYRSLQVAAVQQETRGDLTGAYDAFRAAQSIQLQRGTDPLIDFLLRHDGSDEAINVLAQAGQAAPGSPLQPAWLRRQGQLLRNQAAWVEAEAVYEQLMSLDARDGHTQMAGLALDRGDGVDAALAHLDRAIAVDPGQGDAYYEKARLLSQNKRRTDADHWYREAISRGLDKAGWQLAYGNNARSAGDYPSATERYQQMILRFPDDAAAYYELAWALHLMENPLPAQQAIAAAIQLADKPSVAYHLRAAAIHEQAGDMESALEQLDQVLVIDADNAAAQRAKARLTSAP